MRASALISIRPVLEQAIAAINDSFEREQQAQKNAADFEQEYKRLLALSEGIAPTTELEQSSTTQQPRVRLSRPSIEGLYPWRHRVVLAANALAECGWTIEAGAIHDELNNLPKQQVDWAQPGVRDEMKADIQKGGTRIRDVLACCITEIQAPKSDASSVLPSSNHESTTETVDNPNTTLARKQLRPYVEITEFREYLKEQILKWETWHRAHIEEINDFEGLRDNLHRELTDLQGDEIRHSDDPAGFDTLGHAETCYENYRDIAAGLKDDPEYKLVADREPVLFKEASVASIVALFWCDVNDSTLLVPEYDFLEPEGPFVEYLREQWEKPIQERYKHIDWYVEAAIKTYESRNASAGDEEMEPDSITIDSASSAVPEANQELQVNPPVSVVTPPHVPPISTDDSLEQSRIAGDGDEEIGSDSLGQYQKLWDYAEKMWAKNTDKFKICQHISSGPGNYSACVDDLVPNVSLTDKTKRFHSVLGSLNREIGPELKLEVYRFGQQVLICKVGQKPPEHKRKRSRTTTKKSTPKRKS